jgi:PAS domain S-box-containing protein
MELEHLTGGLADAVGRLRQLLRAQDPDRQEVEAALAEVEELAARARHGEEKARQQAMRYEELAGDTQAELRRCQHLLEVVSDAYLATDLAGVIQQANQAAAALLGTRKEFLRGKPLPFFVTPGQRSSFFQRLGWLRRLEPGTIRQWTVQLTPHRAPPLETAVTVLVDGSGVSAVPLFHWLVRDITARTRAEEALHTQEHFADSLVNTAQVAIAVLDGGGRITRVNAFLEALVGQPLAELHGRDWCAALVDTPERATAGSLLEQALHRGQSARAVHPLRAADGQVRAVEWSLKALAVANGEQGPAVLAIGHDVTGLEQAQRQMLQLERLAAIGQMAAGLAHESRNTLQRSRACLEMLRWKVEKQPDVLDLVTRLQKAQEELLRLYEDVRDYAAPLHLECRPCDVAEVWRDVWAELTALCPDRPVRLTEDSAGVDLVCSANRLRLGQVFRNLLENALAASPESAQVAITCRPAEHAGKPALRIAVRDNGPGVTAEARRRIFEPFYTTKIKGSGLGLAISRRIVEAHGGEIALGQATGTGAEFVILLPRGTP